MKASPRSTAVLILNRVEEERSYAGPLLDAGRSATAMDDIKDRRLLTQIVYGVLRHRGRLDWVLAAFYRGDFPSMEVGLKNILRVGLYQILLLDRIPSYAAVNEAVETARKMFPGRDRLVNGILRGALRGMGNIAYPDPLEEPAGYLSVFHSHPQWLVSRWMDELGVEETRRLCESNNEEPPLTLRVNRLKADRREILSLLRREQCRAVPASIAPQGVILERTDGAITDMGLFRDGYIQPQDEASQLIAHLVEPKPGEMVLDLCSGNGVKTTHLAELMKNRGTIVAVDVNGDKIGHLKRLASRLGVDIVRTLVQDATQDLGASFHEAFDRILVDVPCSGLGTLRRNPEIKWRICPEDLKKLVPLQKKLLNQAAAYLKKGGSIVYSTCTIDREENEDMVRDFLDDHPGFRHSHPPVALSNVAPPGTFFRSFPHHHGMDGFFGAVLQRGE